MRIFHPAPLILNSKTLNRAGAHLGATLAIVSALFPWPIWAREKSPSRAPVAIPIAKIDHAGPVDFEKEILPLFSTSCLACHNKTKAKAGLVLETPADIRKGADQGPVVIAGKADESILLKDAAHTGESDEIMPPPNNKSAAPDLTPAQLGLIKLWIDQGATGEVKGLLAAVAWQPMPSVLDPIYASVVSADGRFAACGRANRIDVYDLAAGKLSASLIDPALQSAGSDAAHRDMVCSLAFSPVGTVLASGSYREVKFWRQTPSAPPVALGDKPATVVATNPQGTLIATAGETGGIRLWENVSAKPVGELSEENSSIIAMKFSPDGKFLAAAYKDKTLRIHEVIARKTFSHVESPIDVHAVAWVDKGNQLAAACVDGTVHLWKIPDALDGEMVAGKILKAYEGPVNALETSADDTAQVFVGGDDGIIRRLNIESGSVTQQIKVGNPIVAMRVSKDGKRVISVGKEGLAVLWNTDDAKKVTDLKTDVIQARQVAAGQRLLALAKREAAYRDTRLEAARKQAKASADRVKKANEGLPLADKTLGEKQKAYDTAKAAADAVATEKDDKKDKPSKDLIKAEEDLKQAKGARTAAEDEIKLADKDLADATEAEKSATAAADAAAAVAKTLDAKASDAKNPADTALKPVRSIALSVDGASIATASEDGVVRFWTTEKGTPLESIHATKTATLALAMAAGDRVVACPADAPPMLSQSGSTWKLERVIDSSVSTSLFADRVTSLDFSTDGKRLVTGGGVPSRSGEIRILNVVDGSVKQSFDDVHSDTVFCVRFSPDGKNLASCAADRFVKMVDLSTGKVIRSLEGHTGHVLGVAFSHDGHTLVSVGADNSVRFWDAETGDRGKVVLGFDKEVTGVTYVGDADTVVAISGEGKVRLVRDNGGDVRSLAGPTDFVYSVSSTADGSTIVVGGQDGILRVWDANSGQSTGTFLPSKPK